MKQKWEMLQLTETILSTKMEIQKKIKAKFK